MCGYVPGLTGPGDDASGAGELAAPAEVLQTAPTERVLSADVLGERVLLAIDTALGSSVALGVGDQILEVSSDDTRGHAEAIGGLLSRVFELAQISPSRVTGVVAGIGPGPFTGLRIGIAAAHAFAVGRGAAVLPLQGHEAVALAVLSHHSAAQFRVVQDAKRRELFVTDYSGLDLAGLPVRTMNARLEPRDTFAAKPGDIWPDRIPAARLVQLAARRLANGRDFEEDRALYLRTPDVKPAAAVKRVSA